METLNEMLKVANEGVAESKKTLQQLANDVGQLSDIVAPALLDHIKQVRASRMTVVAEITQTIQMLRDIRKFFLESDYKEEMQRLKEFVRLCQEIRELKQDGTLDAVADTMLRLAVREEAPNDKGQGTTPSASNK